MAYDTYKDLPKRTTFDKILSDKVFEITINSKYYDYQHEFASVGYNFIVKKDLEILLLLEQEFAVHSLK